MISEGQAREYCYQDISLIENYKLAIADKTQVWHCHHRVETIMNCRAEELKAKGAYWKRPAHELIFLTNKEHTHIHHVGKTLSEETRAKISKARTGMKLSEEHCAKISAAFSGANHPFFGRHLSEEHRAKISAAAKNRSEETRAKIAHKGAHWFNNGTENRFCKECPGDEWQRGRLRNKQS